MTGKRGRDRGIELARARFTYALQMQRYWNAEVEVRQRECNAILLTQAINNGISEKELVRPSPGLLEMMHLKMEKL